MPKDNNKVGTVRYIGIKKIICLVNSKIADLIGWPLLWKYEPPTA